MTATKRPTLKLVSPDHRTLPRASRRYETRFYIGRQHVKTNTGAWYKSAIVQATKHLEDASGPYKHVNRAEIIRRHDSRLLVSIRFYVNGNLTIHHEVPYKEGM